MLVGGGSNPTLYRVSVSRAELATYAPEAAEPGELVACSFDFLLEREPRGSILREFAIGDIERYFPEYPAEIERRL